ncbi:MAG: hypothetical protein P4L55_00010 [Syntrophobacteraceae bacterium]|nr:hypothetical protein [Syntrophobacteraceae bacterium]
MVLTKLKFQECPGSTAGLSPLVDNGMGMQAGTDSNGLGAGPEQYSQLIGKPLFPRAENLVQDKDEEQRRKRAKRANEIFRSVSQSAGLPAFFFDKFLVWSDYVEGRLSDEEFTERVREEVKRKAASMEN